MNTDELKVGDRVIINIRAYEMYKEIGVITDIITLVPTVYPYRVRVDSGPKHCMAFNKEDLVKLII